MIQKIRNWLEALNNYDLVKNQLTELLFLCEGHEQELNGQDRYITELEEQIEPEPNIDDADYWNNKWKKSTVWYSAPKRKKVIEYVKEKSSLPIINLANVLIGKYNLSSNDLDDVPLKVMKWVESQFKARKFKYLLDKGEIWEDPEDVLDAKKGYDCDSYGILMYYVIRQIFQLLGKWDEVKHRLKCVAGNVNRKGSIPSSAGGHFYLLWLHSDGQWYTVETTYYRPVSILNFGKKPQKLNSMYGTIWFTFNESHSWAQHSIVINQKDYKKLGGK